MRIGPAFVMGNRYEKRTDTRKLQYWDLKNEYGKSMSQNLATGNKFENEFNNQDNVLKSFYSLKMILNLDTY